MAQGILEKELNLNRANAGLAGLTPPDRIRWAWEKFGGGLVLSTSFGMYSAVMLHLVKTVCPEIRVIFVDTGYLTPQTYRFKKHLSELFGLAVHTYIPRRTRAELEAIDGAIPDNSAGWEGLYRVAREVKVEPLERALDELKATAWISGVMKGETADRKKFDFIMRRSDGLYKIHPVLDWDSKDSYRYLTGNGLPFNNEYTDIFKPDSKECGIHLTGINRSLTSSEL